MAAVNPIMAFKTIIEGGKKLLFQRVLVENEDGSPAGIATETTLAALLAKTHGTPADITLMTAVAATQAGVAVVAGTYNWPVYGTWNGATAQLQFSPNSGTTWISIDGAALTADGGFAGISFGAGQARVLITGAGGSTSLTSKLLGVP